MRKNPLPYLLMLIGLGLIAYSLILSMTAKPLLQYMSLAPAPLDENEVVTNRPLRDLNEQLDALREELTDFVSAMTISAAAPDIAFVSDENLQLSGTLHAVGEDYFSVYPRALLSGRLLYPEELKWGERACLISEYLSVKLFRTTEPLGRVLTIGGTQYRVVGVLKDESRVGKLSQAEVYVPLVQLARGSIEMETVMATAVPLSGAGASSAFSSAMSGWRAGEVIDVDKENQRALLPARLLVFFVGLGALLKCLRAVKGILRRRRELLREALRHAYARAVAGKIVLLIAIGVAGFTALAAAGALLIWFMVQPVFLFTEWVPSVPVEWSEILKTFWATQAAGAKAISLRSEALLRAKNLALCVNAGVALIIGTWLWRRRVN